MTSRYGSQALTDCFRGEVSVITSMAGFGGFPLSDLKGPFSLDEMRARFEEADVFASGGLPVRWKSISTGTTKVLRFDGDRIYIETQMSEEQQRLGAFTIAEVTKKGSTYVGVLRIQFVCQYYRDWYRKWETNRCAREEPFELTSVTPSRIEGNGFTRPRDSKFDCKKCSYSKDRVWEHFVWIPE